MENNMLIKVNEIPRVEWRNERVMTTAQLADFYETSTDNIRDNFRKNRDHFIDGKHFFKLEGDELKTFRDYTEIFRIVNDRTPSLYLWTKRGAARHAKMLNTDAAWEVYEALEDNYFDRPEIDTTKNNRDPLAVEHDNSIELLANALLKFVALERERLALEREQFNVENSEETKNFKKAQLLRELASAARDFYLRDSLVNYSAKLITGENFIEETHDHDEDCSSDLKVPPRRIK